MLCETIPPLALPRGEAAAACPTFVRPKTLRPQPMPTPRRRAAKERPAGAAAPSDSAPPSGRRPIKRGPNAAVARELLEQYTPMVRRIAGGFQRKLPTNVMRDDLMAAGMSGLWDAIRRHEDVPTDCFEWYARVRIRGAILDDLRAQDWLPRRARAAASENTGSAVPCVVRLDDVSEWEQTRCLSELADSEAAVDAKLASERLSRAVEQLPERERHIVSMHYFKGVRFKELGAELGVSEPRISQLHSRAMQRLRAILEDAA